MTALSPTPAAGPATSPAPSSPRRAALWLGALGGIAGANAFAVVCTAIAGLLVVRLLPQVEYGRVAAFLGTAVLLGLLLGLGLTTRVAGDLARARATGDTRETGRIAGSLLLVRVVTLLPALFLGFGAALLTGDSLYVFAAAVAVAQTLSDFWLGVHQGLQRTVPVAAGFLTPAVLYVGGVVLIQPDTAAGVFAIQIGGYALTAGLLAVAALSPGGLGRPARWSISRSYARAAVGGAGIIYAGLLAQMAFVVGALSALGALGQFTASADLGVALNLARLPLLALAPLVVSLYFPQLCAFAAAPNFPSGFQPWFALWARGSLAVAAAVTAFLLVWPEGPVIVLATEKYLHTAPLLRLLSPLVVALVCDTLVTNTLWATHAAGTALAVAAVRLAVLALLGVAAVALAGSDGQVAASVSAAMTLAGLAGMALHVAVLRVRTGWGLPWQDALRAFAGAGAVAAAGRLAATAAGVEGSLPLFATSVVVTAAFTLLAALTLMGLIAQGLRGRVLATGTGTDL